MLGAILLAAIQLTGVTGERLRARAYFDANNVKVGDPMVLKIDFIGSAEFSEIHPPALSRIVNGQDWKVYDLSAKTGTWRDARQLTYRVRPLREGVLWFPALEFEYESPSGESRLVRSNEIPVHAKPGVDVVVAEMDSVQSEEAPKLELIAVGDDSPELFPSKMDDDLRFAWKRALAKPSADAFAEFDFPAAKLNEATCAVNDGNWARAMKIYGALEWRIGQTEEIERGIVAALALKSDNPAAELPVWRQVLRPLLRFDWKGRVGIVLGAILALVVIFRLIGRVIHAVACAALALLFALPASGERVETVTTNADGSVTTIIKDGSFTMMQTVGGSTTRLSGRRGIEPATFFEDFDPFARRRAPARAKPTIGISLAASKPAVTVGENFNLVLSVEMPRALALADGVQLQIEEQRLLQQTAPGQTMQAVASGNPTNFIQRFVFPMRAIEPFSGPLHFTVSGGYYYPSDSFFLREVRNFSSGVKTMAFDVRPLPKEGRPADFGGVIASGVRLFEYCDLIKVETNDVVTITYRLQANGYVPEDYLPDEVAFEISRADDGIRYCRYFVADGAAETPKLAVSYYDPILKRYKTEKVGGTPLKYTAPPVNSTQKVRR